MGRRIEPSVAAVRRTLARASFGLLAASAVAAPAMAGADDARPQRIAARDLDVTMTVVPSGARIGETIGRRIEIGGERGDRPREAVRGRDGAARAGDREAEDLHEQMRGESVEGGRQEVESGDAGKLSSDGHD